MNRRLCPNCGTELAVDAAACPHCNATADGIWPPPPLNAPPASPLVRLFSGTRWGDIGWGIAIGIVFPLAWILLSMALLAGVSDSLYVNYISGNFVLYFVAASALYRAALPRYPVFARSLGFMFLLHATLLLGLVVLFFVSWA